MTCRARANTKESISCYNSTCYSYFDGVFETCFY
nr:MAG TPA: hypothetical protein [Caudoviricetes sp.]